MLKTLALSVLGARTSVRGSGMDDAIASREANPRIEHLATRTWRMIPPPLFVLGGVISLQVGATFAKQTFAMAGASGTAMLRLLFAAIVLIVVCRPSFRMQRKTFLVVAGYGTVLAAMNMCLYHAIERIPLGVAVTIEFLGPLAVAVLGSRRKLDLLWAVLAAAGVFGLSHAEGGLDIGGVAFALAAGAFWASYIVMGAKLGDHTSGGGGLALGMAVAAIVVLPFGVAEAGTKVLHPPVLIAGVLVAFLSSVVPYSLELEALRRMPTRVFGVLMSVEPAVAALAAMIVLGEMLAPVQWLAICCVVAASVGATRSSTGDTGAN